MKISFETADNNFFSQKYRGAIDVYVSTFF